MRRSEAGVTLIEILVAVTLLSLLSLGMVMAIRSALGAYARTEDKLMVNRRIAGAQRIVQQELEGLVPAFVLCGAASGSTGTKAVLFQGGPASMWLASTFSLQQGWRGQPQLLQLFVAPGGEEGGIRLLVNEMPYNGPKAAGQYCTGTTTVPGSISRLAQFMQRGASPKSFILADKLAFCRFSYYAPPPQYTNGSSSWQTTWHERGWPLALRIEMAPTTANPSQLQPITVTAPIHVRRDPDKNYVEDY